MGEFDISSLSFTASSANLAKSKRFWEGFDFCFSLNEIKETIDQ